MFKLSRTNLANQIALPADMDDTITPAALAQFCIAEEWSGDLSTGIIKLGTQATRLHGMEDNECGLLSLIRCYDTADRRHILDLLEQATSEQTSFCYSTIIHLENNLQRPVICIGQTTGNEVQREGQLKGVFLFPRFMLQESPQPREQDE